MNARGVLQPEVCYLSGAAPDDPEMAAKIEWGIPVGRGYSMSTLGISQVADRVSQTTGLVAVLTSGWTRPATWRAWSASVAKDIPVIVCSDTIMRTRRARADRFHQVKNQLFDGFLTTGSLGREALEHMGVRREQIASGLYPIDTAFWSERLSAEQEGGAALRRELGNPTHVVIAVAKLAERENPIRIVDAFGALAKRLGDVKLILVGDGPLRADVEARLRALKLEHLVFMAGFVKYPQLARYYAAADAFFHVANVEPWGISIAEAMACGLACVATRNIGSARELLIDGETGCFAESTDPDAIAIALKRALELSQIDTTREAIRRAVQRNDVDSASSEVEALVDRLRKRRRRHAFRAVGRVASAFL